MQGKIDLLSNTNMVDFAKEVYMKLHPETDDVPECMFFYLFILWSYCFLNKDSMWLHKIIWDNIRL